MMDNPVLSQAIANMNPAATEEQVQIGNRLVDSASQFDEDQFINSITPRLRQHEGAVKDEFGNHILYKDSMGKMTGGIGHLIKESDSKYYGKPEGTVVAPSDVSTWESDDIKTALSDAKKFLGKSWGASSNEAKEVTTNMAFNLGRGNLSEFTGLQSALKSGDMTKAIDEILFNTKTGKESKWAGQVGQRANDLASLLYVPEDQGGDDDSYTVSRGGKSYANVTAEQLEKSGLSLGDYMKTWKGNDGVRP